VAVGAFGFTRLQAVLTQVAACLSAEHARIAHRRRQLRSDGGEVERGRGATPAGGRPAPRKGHRVPDSTGPALQVISRVRLALLRSVGMHLAPLRRQSKQLLTCQKHSSPAAAAAAACGCSAQQPDDLAGAEIGIPAAQAGAAPHQGFAGRCVSVGAEAGRVRPVLPDDRRPQHAPLRRCQSRVVSRWLATAAGRHGRGLLPG